eukprot:gb/GECG01001638.1/.p1 GENE.gb/GECG01001638.1/~~gb/GECG01001638.1/.p1  ORF type:complete len:182 (+),score=8.02 gb/GECG01001638.1/:1-546(+)
MIANIRKELGPQYIDHQLFETMQGQKEALRILQERLSRAKTAATNAKGKENSISRQRFRLLNQTMKRFFRASINPTPPSQPLLDDNGVYDPERTCNILQDNYSRWIPPLEPAVPDVPIDAQVLRWADLNNRYVHAAIRHEIECSPKFRSCIWEPVLRPVTPKDIKKQCQGRNTSQRSWTME